MIAQNSTLFRLSSLYFRQVWRDISFLVIVTAGLGLLAGFTLISTGAYDAPILPTTIQLVDIVRRFQPGLWALLALFGGELIAREKTVGISPLMDVLPYRTGLRTSAKILAMLGVLLSLLLLILTACVALQSLLGYYEYDLALYAKVLFTEVLFNGLFMIVLSFFMHILVNQRFAGHILIIVLIIAKAYLPVWGMEHKMFHYGGLSLGRYSDLTGFALNETRAFTYYSFYWLGLALLLYGLSMLLVVRGVENGLKARLRIFVRRLSKKSIGLLSMALILWVSSGSMIYYNTTKRNEFLSIKALRKHRAGYELALKQYEGLPAPEIHSVKIDVDLYPEQERYALKGRYTVVNTSTMALEHLYIQGNLNPKVSLVSLSLEREAILEREEKGYSASLYRLSSPLLPGDSMNVSFKVNYGIEGFAQPIREELEQTAFFFTNDHLPALSYQPKHELQSTRHRKAYGLGPKKRELEIDDPKGYDMGINNAHSVQYEARITTDAALWASTSGELMSEQISNGRRHFHYKTTHAIENQFMILTGDWQRMERPVVTHGDTVNVALLHHPDHNTQTTSIMKAMTTAIDYYSRQFSPYQYPQLNLMEVARVHEFAMSVPNTIAYSEALGFTNRNRPKDPAVPFFITAHEVAHQWWGDQVRAARVQGESMIVETLSQYAAGSLTLKVLGEKSLEPILLYERGRYLRGRKREVQREEALATSENQAYIHYGKGLLNMMALRHYIGEDSLNNALARFTRGFPATEKRYPNTRDLLKELRSATPDSMQYLITDLFEKITFWDGRIDEVAMTRGTDSFLLSAKLVMNKYEADQAGVLQEVTLTDWVEIVAYGKNRQGEESVIYQQMHYFGDTELKLDIELAQQPTRLVMDPGHLLMDRNLADNEYQLN